MLNSWLRRTARKTLRPTDTCFLLKKVKQAAGSSVCSYLNELQASRWPDLHNCDAAAKAQIDIDRLLRACATGHGCRALINKRVLDTIPRDQWSHPQYLGQVKWRVRSGQLKRDRRNASRSRLHRRANGRDCTSQFYRYGSANPLDFGGGRLCKREPLYRSILSASQASN